MGAYFSRGATDAGEVRDARSLKIRRQIRALTKSMAQESLSATAIPTVGPSPLSISTRAMLDTAPRADGPPHLQKETTGLTMACAETQVAIPGIDKRTVGSVATVVLPDIMSPKNLGGKTTASKMVQANQGNQANAIGVETINNIKDQLLSSAKSHAAKSGFSPEAIGSLEADQSGFLATRLTTKDGIAAPTSITITGDSCLVADLARNWMPPELTIGVVNNASLKIERGRPKVVLNSCPRPARPDVPSDEGDGACLAFAIVTPVGPDPPSRSKRMEAESLLAMYLEDEVIEGFPASGAEGGNYLAFVSGTYNSMLLSFDIQQQGLTAAQRDAVAAHGYTNPDHVSLLRFPTPALRIMAEEAGAYMCTLRDGRAFSVWMLTYEPHPRTVAALQSSPYFTGYGTQLTHPQLVTQQLTALLNRVRDTHTKVAQIAAQHATNEGKDILDAGNPSLWLLDYDGHAVDVLSNEFDMGLIGNYIYTKYFGRIVPISVVPRNQFKLTDVLVALANDPSKITFMLAAPAFLLPNPLHVYVPPLTISGTPYDIAIPPNLFDGMPSLQVLKGTMAASTSSAPNLQHPLASQLLAMSAATQTDWWRNLAGPALPSSLTDNRISHVRALLSEGCYRLVDMAGAPVPADPVPAAAVAAAAQDGINLLFEGV